jgi:hypothetical protein
MNTNVTNLSSWLTRMLLVLFLITSLVVSACTIDNPSTGYPVPVPTKQNWLDTNVYTDVNKKIAVGPGDKFIIGYSLGNDLFPIIKEIFNSDYVILLDKQTISSDEQKQHPGYCWFLFEATSISETQITIQHFGHLSGDLVNQKVFTINIE